MPAVSYYLDPTKQSLGQGESGFEALIELEDSEVEKIDTILIIVTQREPSVAAGCGGGLEESLKNTSYTGKLAGTLKANKISIQIEIAPIKALESTIAPFRKPLLD